MQYRIDKKTGKELSVLGLGCMRFPRSLGGIDLKKTETIILAAIEKGINYFDTAWIYPGSEEAVGFVLEKNKIRNKVYLASKLPAMLVGKPKDLDRFFDEQLKRLRTDRIDYYLIHNLADIASWKHLVNIGIEAWIKDKKNRGQIGQFGFSFHGTSEEFLKILQAYPWEFCQIQYNYSDENYQAGVRGLKKAAETMPVIIMEPLLGGKLADSLPREAEEIFRAAGSYSPAAQALRWLWNQGEVAVVLSGMNELAQITENAALTDACTANSLTAEELALFGKVKNVFNAANKIPCTGCGYCLPCPQGVNIPGCFSAYNTSYRMGWYIGVKQYVNGTAITSSKSSGPASCVSCGACEKHCPQKIPIMNNLVQVRKRMEPFFVRIILWAARGFMGRMRGSSAE
jgi:predicted aldo/keto reductase-like oxidoreductase